MTTLEMVFAFASGPVGVGVGVAALKLLQRWQVHKEKLDTDRLEANKAVALARIQADDHEDERDDRLIKRLDQRVQKLEKVRDDLHDTLVETKEALLENKALNARLQLHLDTCEERLSALEARMAKVPPDITQKIQLETRREVRRAMSEPHGVPMQREVEHAKDLPPERPFPPRKPK